VQVSIQDFRNALDITGDDAGREAAIVAQLALDLDVTAKFAEPAKARQFLRLRVLRYRGAQETLINADRSSRRGKQ
jgi:hypothetical protein